MSDERPFRYDLCPIVGTSGRRGAVTRCGHHNVVLIADDAPGDFPIIGWVVGALSHSAWTSDGRLALDAPHPHDLSLPNRVPRTVWINFIDFCADNSLAAVVYDSEYEAERSPHGARIGGKAYPVVIEPATP